MFGLGASRFPRVSFRTERPFMYGALATFGLITWLHHSVYKNGTARQLQLTVSEPQRHLRRRPPRATNL